MKCVICDTTNPGFRWTDTHGIGVCSTCGAPYKLYEYDETKPGSQPTSVQIPLVFKDWLEPVRRFWSEKQSRIPHGFDFLGVPRGGSYSGLHAEHFEVFNAWCNANRATLPAAPAKSE